MASKTIREVSTAPLTREEATRMVDAVNRKIIDELCRLPSDTKTNLHKISNLFSRNARAYLWADLFKCTGVSYADIMNGTMDDFRTHINQVNSYLNSLRPLKYGSLFIFNSVYKAGYESIKASGTVEQFVRDPDVCFNDAMLKPFFVAGCMNAMKTLIKNHEAGKFEVNTMIRDKGKHTASKLPLEPVSKTIPTLAQPQMPSCANYCPVTTHAAKMPTNAVSAPTM